MREALLCSTELFLMTSGILSCQITAFLPSDTPNLVNIFHCAKRCRSIMAAGAILLSCCRYNVKYWSVQTTITVALMTIFSNFVASMHDNLPELHENKPIKIISNVIFFCGVFIFYTNFFRWFISIIPTLCKMMQLGCGSRIGDVSRDSDASHTGHLLYPLLYFAATAATAMIILAASKIFPDWDSEGLDSIFYHNLLITTYLFLVIHISERMTKYGIIRGLVSEVCTRIAIRVLHV